MLVTLCLDAGRPAEELLALAAQAERAGWDAVRFGDPPPGASTGRECWAVMGALAAAVPRLRLQAVVRDDLGRHPAVVAKLASTVDRLSEGRLLLGFEPGAGPDGEARLAEGCQVVKSLARGERASLRGRFYRLEDAPFDPRPLQQPFPVMVVGGSAPLAARCGDHWSITGSPEEVRAQLEALRVACDQIGRDAGGITVSAWAGETGATAGETGALRETGATAGETGALRETGATAGETGALRETGATAGETGALRETGALGGAAAATYMAAGVDEWVVPSAAFGGDRAGWPDALARIAAAVKCLSH